ncbi:MAG: hypothetical protein U9R79_08320 [Armatimonadota bacterium]|nr:hypothetical protein [Armatimonadota bacterium]
MLRFGISGSPDYTIELSASVLTLLEGRAGKGMGGDRQERVGRVGRCIVEGVSRLWRDEEAATTVEYALMLAVMALSAVIAYQALARVAQDSVTAGTEGLGRLTGEGGAGAAGLGDAAGGGD